MSFRISTLPAGFVALLLLSGIGPLAAEDWPHWAGPRSDFTVTSGQLAESWPDEGPRRLWERPLGAGTSSPVVVGDRLFTLYRDGDEEVLVALETASGETVWEHRDPPTFWPDMVEYFGVGPNSTPAWHRDRVFGIGISGLLRVVDARNGALLWQKDLPGTFGRVRRVEEYGYSANPMPWNDTVLVLVGGQQAAVVAFEPESGSVVWSSAGGGASYAQPNFVHLAGRDQFLYFEPEGIVALDPDTGETLWKHPIEFNNGNHLTPAVLCDSNHLWVSSQFDTGGGRLLRVREQAEGFAVEEVWSTPRLQTSHWPLIRRGDFLYGSIGGNRTSTLAAVNWRTGDIAWRKRGFHKAQALWADGKLLFLDEGGQLALARVTPEEVTVLAQTPVAKADAWTLPTLVGSTLYVRDTEKILALDLAPTPGKAPKSPSEP